MKLNTLERCPATEPIRYGQCWEDADVLLDALAPQPGSVCLSVASAGDNSLALLTRNPARVVAVDISVAQLNCLALRVAAYRRLEYLQLLELFGSRPSTRRQALFERCRVDLTPEVAAFWDARVGAIECWGLGGVGRFEAYFRLFRRWILPWVHGNASVQELLQTKPVDGRRRFYAQHWHTGAWHWLVRAFFSHSVMARLGRDPACFRYVQGNVASHVERRVAHALQELDPADNPYLQWILTGQHSTALPLALRPQHFDTIRANLERLEWRHQSVQSFAESGERVDAFNLSDVFEYMSEKEHDIAYGQLLGCANPGARLAYWNMLVPRFAPASWGQRIEPLDQKALTLHARDKAFFYSRFVLEVVR
jgi:S-adenosylmethionine-diacylglycerol 3-amino-3-carboxypropyl transferase